MHPLRFISLSIGMVLCLMAMGMTMSSASVQAQSLPERPTLTPIPPTEAPSSSSKTAVPTGRITGTVIDSSTGAPAPNLTVMVGDVSVTTDANGNYDRNGLAAGSYAVALSLTSSQGVAEQSTITVVLADGATVIQHLRFRSPVVAPLPTAAPTAVPAPSTLPNTGGNDTGMGMLIVGIALLLTAGLVRRRA